MSYCEMPLQAKTDFRCEPYELECESPEDVCTMGDEGENVCKKATILLGNGEACTKGNNNDCNSKFCDNATATCACKTNTTSEDSKYQGKCDVGGVCIETIDCSLGSKCKTNPDNANETICVAPCSMINTEGKCFKGEVCGSNEACGTDNNRKMFCKGLSGAPGETVSDQALGGLCDVWMCSKEGTSCLADGDCCMGTCDLKNGKVCKASTSMDLVTKKTTAKVEDKVQIGFEDSCGDFKMKSERRKFLVPVVDTYTSKTYESEALWQRASLSYVLLV